MASLNLTLLLRSTTCTLYNAFLTPYMLYTCDRLHVSPPSPTNQDRIMEMQFISRLLFYTSTTSSVLALTPLPPPHCLTDGKDEYIVVRQYPSCLDSNSEFGENVVFYLPGLPDLLRRRPDWGGEEKEDKDQSQDVL